MVAYTMMFLGLLSFRPREILPVFLAGFVA